MKIYLDGTIFTMQTRGGISRYFIELSRELSKLDQSLEVVTVLPEVAKGALPDTQINTTYLPLTHKFKNQLRPFNQLLFEKYLSRLTSGLIHSSYFNNYKSLKIPNVVTVYDLIYEQFPDLYYLPQERDFVKQKEVAIRQADAVICISETVRNDTIDYYQLDQKKVFAVPLGVRSLLTQVSLKELPLNLKPNTYILFVGHRSKHKNFSRLLTAYHKSNARKDFKLVCVGGKNWSFEEQQYIQENNLNNNVLLLHGIDDSDLSSLYTHAYAYISPSLQEGFGLPILEAMACGTSVIASDIPVYKEVASKIPHYFDPTKISSITKALESFNPQKHKSSDSIKKANEYTWEKTAIKTLEIYKKVIQSYES